MCFHWLSVWAERGRVYDIEKGIFCVSRDVIFREDILAYSGEEGS